MGEPRATVGPAATEEAPGAYVVRRPPGWSMLMTGRPATQPANTTTPFPAARTGVQGGPRTSAPRWPAANGWGGGPKGRVTVRSPSIGGLQRTPRSGAGDGAEVGSAVAGMGAKRTVEPRSRRARRGARTGERSRRTAAGGGARGGLGTTGPRGGPPA